MALALVASVLLLAPATAAAATTLVVSPVNMQGWTTQHYAGAATQGFVSGPATPPLGSGSYQLSVPGTWEFEALILDSLAGTRLDAITKLSYSTYLRVAGAAPYLIFALDLNGGGWAEDELIWEPITSCPPHPSCGRGGTRSAGSGGHRIRTQDGATNSTQ